MFSFSDVPIPNEIVPAHILPLLSLEDLLAFRLVSKPTTTLSDNDAALCARIKKDYGISVHSSHCRQKLVFLYLFEKGITYLYGAAKSHNKKLKQRAIAYFSMAKSQIETLSTVHPDDKSWINYRLGCIQLGIHDDIDKGISYLLIAAYEGNTNALLLLAAIYSPIIAKQMHNTSIQHQIILPKIDFSHIDPKQGMAYLMLAYDNHDRNAAIIYANLLSETAPYTNHVIANMSIDEITPHLESYNAASEQGSIEATVTLLNFYASGMLNGIHIKTPTPFDIISAIDYLNKLVELGSSYGALSLGMFYLNGSCTLSSHTNLIAQEIPNTDKALTCFIEGTKKIKDFDFISAGKCAFALATHYHQQGDLEKAFRWYQKGADLGHFDCSMEAGYLCLHYYETLKLMRATEMADGYFDDALMITTNTREALPLFKSTPPPRCTANDIANYFISHIDAEKHINVNLQQYIKWKCRAILFDDSHAAKDLKTLFAADYPFETIFSSNSFDQVFQPKKPFNIKICNTELVKHIRSLCSTRKTPSASSLNDLAKRCYKALDLPEIEDTLLTKSTTSSVTTSRPTL